MAKKFKPLPPTDTAQLLSLYKKLQLMNSYNNILGKLKQLIFLSNGMSVVKSTGKKSSEIHFGITPKPKSNKNTLYINLAQERLVTENRIKLVELVLNSHRIKVLIDDFNLIKNNPTYNQQLSKYIDQLHPEALSLFSICQGKGIDVGCGYRKTHPKATGVDWVKKGDLGKVGNVKGKSSEADIQAEGDKLNMFKDKSLNYVIARHNLEHYKNPLKTLNEWVRVLKKGGTLALIVPNSQNPQTFEQTHYFEFTLDNLQEMVEKTKQLKVIYLNECIPGWSFICVAHKL